MSTRRPRVGSARQVSRNGGKYYAGTHLHGEDAQERIYKALKKAEKEGRDVEAELEKIGRKMEQGKWC